MPDLDYLGGIQNPVDEDIDGGGFYLNNFQSIQDILAGRSYYDLNGSSDNLSLYPDESV